MKIRAVRTAVGTALLFVPIAICGAAAKASTEPAVVLYVNNGQKIRGFTLGLAQKKVNAIFASAGVPLTWKSGTPRKSLRTAADCAWRPIEIGVDFVSGPPADTSPDAFARSFPYAEHGFRIEVFVDRLEAAMRLRPLLLTGHLAYVLAHEITHLLQGIVRHSDTGIMRGRWSEDEYQQMLMARPLPFEPIDISLIQEGMSSRRAKACAAQIALER
jgi:hypothetical protein